MKITVFKNPNTYMTRDYDLTNCSIAELEKSLFQHCEIIGVVPSAAAVFIPRGEYRSDDYIIKGTTTNMSMEEVAVHLLRLYGRSVDSRYEVKSQLPKKTKFANGFDWFCKQCTAFFSVQMDKDHDGSIDCCPCCGEACPINTIEDLLLYCGDYDTDPVNFYQAFPQDEPIPGSRTGATPRQADIIISIVSMRRGKKLPVKIESIAGENDFYIDLVRKVFEELHITETEGAL